MAIALLNGPKKDQMAQDILGHLEGETKRAEMALLSHQFATYHEYAAAFNVYTAAKATEDAIRRTIKKHLED